MLKPLKNKVIVEVEKQDKTESGLVLTNNLETDSIIAKICSLPKYFSDKDLELQQLNIGDKVIISKFSGNKIEYDKKEYLVLDIDSILAIIEEE